LHKLINKSSVPYTTSFSASMSNLSYYFKDDSTVPCPPRAERRTFRSAGGRLHLCMPDLAWQGAASPPAPAALLLFSV
ncbi:MAG: hypothetical protein RR376_15005, partial [Janthinobacterium sp.]